MKCFTETYGDSMAWFWILRYRRE